MNQVQPRFEHIIPDIAQWPVARISRERKQFVEELNLFVMDRVLKNYEGSLGDIISKTIYSEQQRIKLNPWKVDPPNEKEYWKNITQELELIQAREDRVEAEKELLHKIINRYSEEIVGHFMPGTFKLSRNILTSLFKRLFTRYFGRGQWRWGSQRQLGDRIKVVGDLPLLRKLFQEGVVVVLPTHHSNLDSIMVGYTVDTKMGLPAFAYGAGLNLYNVELAAYFMNRLGAYRVDRRKKNPIYLECLKSMSAYALTKNVNSIFFPGGTRSRSGATETRVKLGLLSSVIEAQRLHLMTEKKKKIFIVTLNIGYHFVLEGASLIDQYLRETGREKYQRSRNLHPGFSDYLRFVKNLFVKESEVYMSLGQIMDVFGNSVNENGESVDKFGHKVQIDDYFLTDGILKADTQRESIYTRILGEAVVSEFQKNNVALSSNVVSFVAFQLLYEKSECSDLITFLIAAPQQFSIVAADFESCCYELIGELRKMEAEGLIRCSQEFNMSDPEIVKSGLQQLGVYHQHRVVARINEAVYSEDLRLLYFYHNRLSTYPLQQRLSWVKTFEV